MCFNAPYWMPRQASDTLERHCCPDLGHEPLQILQGMKADRLTLTTTGGSDHFI